MRNTPKVKELNLNWDDKICELIHKKCHQIVNTMAQKMPLLFSVVLSYAPCAL